MKDLNCPSFVDTAMILPKAVGIFDLGDDVISLTPS
jgi:hypothetical protein